MKMMEGSIPSMIQQFKPHVHLSSDTSAISPAWVHLASVQMGASESDQRWR